MATANLAPVCERGRSNIGRVLNRGAGRPRMDKEQLLLELEEIFELDEGEIAPEMKLDGVIDSLSILLIIELFDVNFSKALEISDFEEFQDVASLLKVAGL